MSTVLYICLVFLAMVRKQYQLNVKCEWNHSFYCVFILVHAGEEAWIKENNEVCKWILKKLSLLLSSLLLLLYNTFDYL